MAFSCSREWKSALNKLSSERIEHSSIHSATCRKRENIYDVTPGSIQPPWKSLTSGRASKKKWKRRGMSRDQAKERKKACLKRVMRGAIAIKSPIHLAGWWGGGKFRLAERAAKVGGSRKESSSFDCERATPLVVFLPRRD